MQRTERVSCSRSHLSVRRVTADVHGLALKRRRLHREQPLGRGHRVQLDRWAGVMGLPPRMLVPPLPRHKLPDAHPRLARSRRGGRRRRECRHRLHGHHGAGEAHVERGQEPRPTALAWEEQTCPAFAAFSREGPRGLPVPMTAPHAIHDHLTNFVPYDRDDSVRILGSLRIDCQCRLILGIHACLLQCIT